MNIYQLTIFDILVLKTGKNTCMRLVMNITRFNLHIDMCFYPFKNNIQLISRMTFKKYSGENLTWLSPYLFPLILA